MASGKRKMLAARDDLVEQVSTLAANEGLTLFGVVNHLLELKIKANKHGINLDKAIANNEQISAIKTAGFTLILENLLYETTEIAYKNAPTETQNAWFQAGVWIAKQYKTKHSTPLAILLNDLIDFGWNINEVTLENQENQIYLRILSPRFTESYTHLFCLFIEGVLQTLNYQITTKDAKKGIIRLNASKRENNA